MKGIIMGRVIIGLLLISLFSNEIYAAGSWYVNKNYAMSSVKISGAKNPNTEASVYVAFLKSNNCRPESGMIISTDYDIGKPVERRTSQDYLSMQIGRKIFTGKTTLSQYVNAIDMTIRLRDDDLKYFSNSGFLTVKFSENLKNNSIDFSLKNAKKSIYRAKSNCL